MQAITLPIAHLRLGRGIRVLRRLSRTGQGQVEWFFVCRRAGRLRERLGVGRGRPIFIMSKRCSFEVSEKVWRSFRRDNR
jgi:hypothetical protein